MKYSPVQPSDVRGYVQLGFDAVRSVTDVVEAMHANIARTPWPWERVRGGRTHGITGFVYNCVRAVTQAVAGSADVALSGLLPLVEHASGEVQTGYTRTALVALVNGVVGDHLLATGNPLAQAMQWRIEGRPLQLSPPTESAAASEKSCALVPQATGRVLVTLHGLCMSDSEWRQRDGYDLGAVVADALSATRVDLLYNSGLHVSTNGHALARQLQALVDAWPVPVTKLYVLGFSMGGLLARSACHYAAAADLTWRERLHTMVFVGTPHHGAPLERGGNWLQTAAGWVPYTAPLARLGMLRSAGVTDLRYSNLLDEDWDDDDRFARNEDTRHAVPLPAGVRCLAVAGTLGACRGDAKDRALGDGLVPIASGLGEHHDAGWRLAIDEDDKMLFCRTGHLGLLARHDVGEWLAARLSEPSTTT
ncbi:MAG TPA: hypothetical protein VFQ88_05875 [Nevskiaceae bacterium]|nr:hypothetical protein [Nevskiaceae bacterium]